MRAAILAHLRTNVIGYVALFAALGGTSYAAVRLKPGSVTSAALATRSVTHAKLAANSVTSANVARHSLVSSDFQSGVLTSSGGGAKGGKGDSGSTGTGGTKGAKGETGLTGPAGPVGSAGPQGAPGGATVGARARMSGGSVTAPIGAKTSVPLSANSWTQLSSELDLITGSMTVQVPASCTGSFGNALTISVDGVPQTFASAPTAPASGTVTMPLNVGTLTDPGQSVQHTVTASFGNSCTKSGENYTVSDVKLDIVRVP
jgi:hypothetical protein